MSITAFPVLARILEDRGLTQTRLGSIAIACAAVDDVTAWCLLAVVIAIAKSNGFGASIVTVVLVILFIGIMLFLIKPRIEKLIRVEKEKHSKGLLAGILAFALACALITESIGIHALFGAFLAGVVMPSDAGFRLFLKEKLEVQLNCFAAALLCVYRIAYTSRSDQRLVRLADLLRDNYCRGCRQTGRQHAGGSLDEDELARLVLNRHLDEHARVGRVGSVEYRL